MTAAKLEPLRDQTTAAKFESQKDGQDYTSTVEFEP